MTDYSVLEDEDLALEDDDYFAAEDEDYALDEAFTEDEDAAERRRRRSRGRSRLPSRVRAGRLGQGRGYLRAKPSPRPATVGNLRESLEKVGKDIRANAAAIKRVEAQVNKATKEIAAVNNRQDTAIADARSDLKKHAAGAQQQAQFSMLMPLLEKSPELEARPGQEAAAAAVLQTVQVKKQDNTMALVLMMMSMSQMPGVGGSSSSNTMNQMLPLVLLLSK